MDSVIITQTYGGIPYATKPIKIDKIAPKVVVSSFGKLIKAICDAGHEGIKTDLGPMQKDGQFIFAIRYNLASPEGLLVQELQRQLPTRKTPYDKNHYLSMLERNYSEAGLPHPVHKVGHRGRV